MTLYLINYKMIEDNVDETSQLVDNKIRDTSHRHQSHLKKKSGLEELDS